MAQAGEGTSGAGEEAALALGTGDAATLTAAIQDLDAAVASPTLGVTAASALVALLHARHIATGDVADLHRAVAVGFRALSEVDAQADAHGGRSSSLRLVFLANLANTFRLRHEAAGSRADLDEALRLGRAALALRPGQPAQERAVVNNLAICFRLRAGLDVAPHDAREAVRLGRRAMELTASGDPQQVAVLTNLAGAHHVHYELTGDLGALRSAVTLSRSAVLEASPTDRLRPHLLSNLAASLQLRAERAGHEEDVEEAVEVARAAVAETVFGDPLLAARLSNLATAYLLRFDHGEAAGDLGDAIGTARRALGATAGNDPARAGRASNLAAALRIRFERVPAPDDLAEALAAAREAVRGSRPGQLRVAHLSTLATVLRAAFRHDGTSTYGTEAVAALREAVAECSPDSPDRASVLSNLGAVLYELHEHRPDLAVLVEAEAAFREATNVVTARPHVRVSTASSWGRIAAEHGDVVSAHDGLSTAVEMLGLLAPVEMLEEDQERGLRRHAGIAADAAACALELGDANRALALLELGRGIMMRRLVDARSDLALLAARAPDLAARLEESRRRLDLARGAGVRGPGSEERRAVVADVEETLDRIRALPGFRDFLRPPSVEGLLPVADRGPVVVVNVSELRCDALVVEPTGVRHVRLPQLSARELSGRLLSLGTPGGDGSDGRAPDLVGGGLDDAWDLEMTDLLAWLWEAVTGPVLADLGLDADAPRVGPPRLWWVPTGLMSFAPLHAARSRAGECVLDRVVSSYTPTLHALTFARRQAEDTPPRAVVTAPSGHRGGGLPAAVRESRAVAGLIGCPVTVLTGRWASRQTVMAELGRSTWAHLTGHASADPVFPTRSSFDVHDPDGTALSVADLTRLDLRHAQGAFLSACTTSRSTRQLSDESLHLASACQLAGFRHVVGTLWPVRDPVSLRAARSYYRHLSAGGAPSGERSAPAVRRLAQDLRHRYPDRPSCWAAYVHAGA